MFLISLDLLMGTLEARNSQYQSAFSSSQCDLIEFSLLMSLSSSLSDGGVDVVQLGSVLAGLRLGRLGAVVVVLGGVWSRPSRPPPSHPRPALQRRSRLRPQRGVGGLLLRHLSAGYLPYLPMPHSFVPSFLLLGFLRSFEYQARSCSQLTH